jgi:hypothetical protein
MTVPTDFNNQVGLNGTVILALYGSAGIIALGISLFFVYVFATDPFLGPHLKKQTLARQLTASDGTLYATVVSVASGLLLCVFEVSSMPIANSVVTTICFAVYTSALIITLSFSAEDRVRNLLVLLGGAESGSIKRSIARLLVVNYFMFLLPFISVLLSLLPGFARTFGLVFYLVYSSITVILSLITVTALTRILGKLNFAIDRMSDEPSNNNNASASNLPLPSSTTAIAAPPSPRKLSYLRRSSSMLSNNNNITSPKMRLIALKKHVTRSRRRHSLGVMTCLLIIVFASFPNAVLYSAYFIPFHVIVATCAVTHKPGKLAAYIASKRVNKQENNQARQEAQTAMLRKLKSDKALLVSAGAAAGGTNTLIPGGEENLPSRRDFALEPHCEESEVKSSGKGGNSSAEQFT